MLTVDDLLRGPRPAGSEEDPIDHLSACHRRVEQRLETLARAGERFPKDRAAALSAIDGCLEFFATNGVRHTADEEESLFPRLLPRLSAADKALIEGLEAEHKTADLLHLELTGLAAALSQAPSDEAPLNAFRDCVQRLTVLYRRHIELEDTQVAAMARRNLTASELAAMKDEMKRRRRQEATH